MAADLETGEPQSQAAPAEQAAPNRRMLLFAALLVFAGVFALGAMSWTQFFLDPQANGGSRARLFTQTDFPAYVLASRLIASGRGTDLYDLNVQYEEQTRLREEGHLSMSNAEASALRYPYPYTPLAAVLLSPLVSAPPLAVMAIWDLVNLAAFAGGLWMLVKSLALDDGTRWAILLAGLSSFPFISNLEQGQSSGLVMLALGGGIALLAREQDLPAGLFLGLLLVKIQWLPFLVLVLLWKWRWRALVGLGAAVLALSALVFVTAGVGWIPGYLSIFGQAQDFSPALLLDPSYSHSFTGLLADILGTGNNGIIKTLSTLLMAALAVGMLYVWRKPWRPRAPYWYGAMCLTILAAIFTQPQLNTHDLCLLAIPAALALALVHTGNMSQAVRTAVYAAVWLMYLAPVLIYLLGFSLPLRLTALSIALLLCLIAYLLFRRSDPAPGTAPA